MKYVHASNYTKKKEKMMFQLSLNFYSFIYKNSLLTLIIYSKFISDCLLDNVSIDFANVRKNLYYPNIERIVILCIHCHHLSSNKHILFECISGVMYSPMNPPYLFTSLVQSISATSQVQKKVKRFIFYIFVVRHNFIKLKNFKFTISLYKIAQNSLFFK